MINPNWDYVKKATLWNYEQLIKKLNAVIAYPVIWQVYNHSMPQAKDFARRLFADKNIAAGEYPAQIVASMERFQQAGLENWADLLARVATRTDCLTFVDQNHLGFEEVIDGLNYLLRWAFPFYTASRELLDHENPQEMAYYLVMKQHKLMCSFDMLERGRTQVARRVLAEQTGLPFEFVNRLVHRADIARLPYVRRKTILPVCGAGYDTLAKIAAADLQTMENDLDIFFRQNKGKAWNDFKSVILLRGLVTGAKALPEILS